MIDNRDAALNWIDSMPNINAAPPLSKLRQYDISPALTAELRQRESYLYNKFYSAEPNA